MKEKIALLCSLCLGSCKMMTTSSAESISTSSASIEPIIQPVRVILLAGQSNAAGYTRIDQMDRLFEEEEIKKYKTGFEKIKIRFSCEEGINTSWRKFIPVALGQGKDNLCFGPEVGMGEYLSNSGYDEIYIIKYAVGGTTLVSDWRSPSSGTIGRCYQAFIDFVHESIDYLKKEYKQPVIEALCWMQGESDADEAKSKYYYGHLSSFVKDIRQEFQEVSSEDGIGFIDAGISDWDWWTHYQKINAAKQQFASESEQNIYIDTIAAQLSYRNEPVNGVDGCHYDSDGMILLGTLFGQMVAEHFLTEK